MLVKGKNTIQIDKNKYIILSWYYNWNETLSLKSKHGNDGGSEFFKWKIKTEILTQFYEMW